MEIKMMEDYEKLYEIFSPLKGETELQHHSFWARVHMVATRPKDAWEWAEWASAIVPSLVARMHVMRKEIESKKTTNDLHMMASRDYRKKIEWLRADRNRWAQRSIELEQELEQLKLERGSNEQLF